MAITKIGTDIIADDAITADKIAAGALDTQLAGYLSTNSFATESYVGTAISNLVDSSPATLDTLNELAAALGDDPNFATTTATAIGLKAPLTSPSFTGSATFSDNVGIGTDNPGYLLTVKKDVNAFAVKIENDGNSAGTSGASYADASDGLWVDTRWNTATNTPFKVTSNSGTTPMMIIKGDGKVGIGTDAPTVELDVYGDGSGVSVGRPWGNDSYVSSGYFGKQANTGGWGAGSAFMKIEDSLTTGVRKGTSIDFVTHNYGVGNQTTMSLTGNGNVGIGTSPQSFAKLQVKAATDQHVSVFTNSSGLTIGGLTDAGGSGALRIAGSPLRLTGQGGGAGSGPDIEINGSGGVSMPNQPHSYGTFGSGNLSTDTGWTMVPISTVALTYNNNASHGYGMTVQQAGYYQMTGMGLYAPAMSYVYIGWCVNGIATYHWHSNHTIDGNHDFVASIIRYCNVGDHITMENQNARTLSNQWGTGHSQYHIYKLG